MNIRTDLLEGNLTLPSLDKFISEFGEQEADVAARLFKAGWHAFLLNKGTINLPYWAEQFKSVKTFNRVLKVLADNGWFETHSIPARNWAEAELLESKLLEYVNPDELAHIRAEHKLKQYMPEELESVVHNLTKQNGATKYTGLERYGFKASSGTKYSYDTDKLTQYSEAITANVNKGMQKIRNKFPMMASDEASYDTVAASIVDKLCSQDQIYSMGSNFSDSRGRAIKEGLSKVANPIGYKDFRALLVVPKDNRNEATKDGVKAVYLFIAELLGFKSGTITEKETVGVVAYNTRRLHELNLKDEDDRKELNENIWLERLYEDLDGYYSNDYYEWVVPIELDAAASLIQHVGLLLGDRRLLEMTNVIDTGTLTDPWYVEGLSRYMVKTAATPDFYGSKETCGSLWRKAGIEFTLEDVATYEKAVSEGGFGLIREFKDFILRWVNTQEVMYPVVYEDSFEVQCNKFKHVGEVTVKYDIYDSITRSVRRIHHTKTKNVADLEQFKTFWVTGLIHSIDSQVLNFVMENVMPNYGWGIDIHDAVVCCPETASDVRQWYGEELKTIYDNRDVILSKYFNSIGIGAEAIEDWKALKSKIVPVGELVVSPMALK